MKRTLLIGLLSCLALGCASAPAEVPPPAERPAPTPDQLAVARGDNEFAFDLFKQLHEKEGNLFLSPASISTALAMTYVGARGQTAEQMAKALHFTLPPEKLNPAFAALIRDWNGEGIDPKQRGYQLSVANALWGQNGYPWKPKFLETTKKYYGAGLREVDFIGATEAARKTINAWVEKETKDRIKELVPEGVLDADTKLVLTNAIYFKGDWAAQFDKKRTFDQSFNLSADRKVKVPMMHRTGDYRFLDGGTFQALEMPYKGNEMSMLVLLPKKIDGLADLEKSLTADKLADWYKRLNETEDVEVTFPKFKVTAEFSLNDELKKLGMTDAFGGKADFSGMNGKKNDLFISAVLHKAFVEVNEEGSEAAAATAVIVKKEAAVDPQMKPVFRADHPFVFVIRDNRTGSVLFVGRVADPSK